MNSILDKILNFLNSIFNKEKTMLLASGENANINKDVQINEMDNSFADRVKIQENEEERRILELQKLYKGGKIQEVDMEKEDVIKLKELYKTQIEKTKISINNYKNKIMNIRKQFANNS